MKLHISSDEVRDILCSHAASISTKHQYNAMEEAEDGGVILSYVQPAGTWVPRPWYQRWLGFRLRFVPAPSEQPAEAVPTTERVSEAINQAVSSIHAFGKAVAGRKK